MIYSLSPDWEVMYELDGRGFLKSTNKPMTGWRAQNVYAGDILLVNQKITEAVKEKQVFELEHRVNRADGTIGWTISKAVPVLDEEGNILEWFGTAKDITARKQAEEKLVASNEQLRIATESGELGTWYYEHQSGRFETSERFNWIFGLPLNQQSSYQTAFNCIREDYQDRVAAAVQESFETGCSFKIEYPIDIQDKNERWVRSVGKMGVNAHAVTYVTGVLADITEQKMDDVRKNDFIGMVSHELKTPLTSLSAIIQVMRLKLSNHEDNFLNGATKKAEILVKRMGTMINGFLNISRLESGKIIINKQEFFLHELIKEVVAEFEMTTSSHVVEVINCDDVVVNADRDKISSVLSNLISNAIKYSHKDGLIKIYCKKADRNVIVSVHDSGIGIPTADLPKIFERYYRVESRKTQHISGFGIGLYLSAEIVQRHNGRIWAESESGNGSTFYFSLPAEETA